MSSNLPANILKDWDVVIVDDEPDSLYLAEHLLTYYQATVHTAVNGAQGLEVIQRIKPRFVLSDLSMPQVNGWTMIANLKADPNIQHIAVIALTAHSMVGDRERVMAAGFHSYIAKPLSVDTFITDLLRQLSTVPYLAAELAHLDLDDLAGS